MSPAVHFFQVLRCFNSTNVTRIIRKPPAQGAVAPSLLSFSSGLCNLVVSECMAPNFPPQLLTVFKSVRIAPGEGLCQSRKKFRCELAAPRQRFLRHHFQSLFRRFICFAGARALNFKQGYVKCELNLHT